MKKKSLLLFLLLSVAPFMRGCGETFGFPMPAMDMIISSGDPAKTWSNLAEALRSAETLALMLANALFAVLCARVFSRNAERLRWISGVMAALAAGLAMIWIMTALYAANIGSDEPKTVTDRIARIYSGIFFFIYYSAPEKIIRIITGKGAVSGTLEDVFYRAWFVVVTFVAGWAMYGVGILRRRR